MAIDGTFKNSFKTIGRYRDSIKISNPDFLQQEVTVKNYDHVIQPWHDWVSQDSPFWWTAYNKVKHERTSIVEIDNVRDIVDQLTDEIIDQPAAPFVPQFKVGEFTKIRSKYVNKEHLSACAVRNGLDQYILYGSGEEPGESSREDMIEALIGAVAIDSSWDWDLIGAVVDRIICVQLGQPGLLLKETFYDVFNSWHQKHFGCMPEYQVTSYPPYWATIRYQVPENDKGIALDHTTQARGDTRSQARELAAEFAYRYVTMNGLWINLKDAGIVPRLEDSINQLQELYQKKYVEDRPEYVFREENGDTWRCDCECGGIAGHGTGPNKKAAKKKAAYMVLTKLFVGLRQSML